MGEAMDQTENLQPAVWSVDGNQKRPQSFLVQAQKGRD